MPVKISSQNSWYETRGWAVGSNRHLMAEKAVSGIQRGRIARCPTVCCERGQTQRTADGPAGGALRLEGAPEKLVVIARISG